MNISIGQTFIFKNKSSVFHGLQCTVVKEILPFYRATFCDGTKFSVSSEELKALVIPMIEQHCYYLAIQRVIIGSCDQQFKELLVALYLNKLQPEDEPSKYDGVSFVKTATHAEFLVTVKGVTQRVAFPI